ncbi:hypothetical protein KY335_01075 [Candidatus Woesearchaeota archaeon]|nr:hypothetical protein [Candidatus Woesearchaeota archaeon]
MKKLALAMLIIGLVMLSGCANIEKENDTPHSDDWKQIEEVLYNQCKARIRENWDLLGSLYSFTEDSFEYKDLKRISKLSFRTVSILSCDYTVKEIKFSGEDTAFVTADLHIKEFSRKDIRDKREMTVTLPPEDDPNFLKMTKINGEWKFCPAKDCAGRPSDKYSCEDGSMVDQEKDCPILDLEFYSEKNLFECAENNSIENLLPVNIGPFMLNPVSIIANVNDTKIYKASEYKIGKFDILLAYSADYQKLGDNKRIFNLAYLELGDELDFLRYVNETHAIIRELMGQYEGAREEDLEFGGTIANVAYFPTASEQDKAVTITKRAYIYIPEKNAVFRFLFNDWLTEDEVMSTVSTYFNNLCGA